MLATPTPDNEDSLNELETSPDKLAQARSVAEHATSSIESLLQERQRSQNVDNELQTYEPTPPVSHPISSPPHSGVPYLSPSSVDASAACMQTSAALVTIISRQMSGDNVTMEEASEVTSAPSLPPSAVYATAGTLRSCTPSQLGSLAKIQEDSAASSPEAHRSTEPVSNPEAHDDVQARLRASCAGRLSEVGMRVHSSQDIGTCDTKGCTLQLAGIDVEEIEVGMCPFHSTVSSTSRCAVPYRRLVPFSTGIMLPSYESYEEICLAYCCAFAGQVDSEDLLLPMAPLSTVAKKHTNKSFTLDEKPGDEGTSGASESDQQNSPGGQYHDLAAVSDNTMGSQTVYSFGCGQPRGSTAGLKSP